METTTMKRLPALPAEAQTMASHMVSTYSIDINQGHHSAKLTLPHQMIEVTLDSMIMVMGIINSCCQVMIIFRDIWEKLRTPMKNEQVMFMEADMGNQT